MPWFLLSLQYFDELNADPHAGVLASDPEGAKDDLGFLESLPVVDAN